MPWKNLDDAPFRTYKDLPLTLAQVNHWGRIHDGVLKSLKENEPKKKVEELETRAAQIAWTTWKRLYEKNDKGTGWRRKKKRKSSETTTLYDIYGYEYVGEIPRNEILSDYVASDEELGAPLDVKVLQLEDLKKLRTMRGDMTVMQAFTDFAEPEQMEIVDDYKTSDLSREYIVLSGDRVVDGNHRVVAAVLSRQLLKAVDIDQLEDMEVESSMVREVVSIHLAQMPCEIYGISEHDDNEEYPGDRDFYDILEDVDKLFKAAGIRMSSMEEYLHACMDDEGTVLGASVAGISGQDEESGLSKVVFSIVVDPSSRRRGVAKALVQGVLDVYSDMEVVFEPWVVNPDMARLLENHFGFEPNHGEWSPRSPYMRRTSSGRWEFAWTCPSPPWEPGDFEFADPSEDPDDYATMVDYLWDHADEVSYGEFERAVGGKRNILDNLWGGSVYDKYLRIQDDQHVSWLKSQYPDGTPVYFHTQSGIEHVYEPAGWVKS